MDEDCEWNYEHDSFVDLSVEPRWLLVDSEDFEFFDPVFENEVECEYWQKKWEASAVDESEE